MIFEREGASPLMVTRYRAEHRYGPSSFDRRYRHHRHWRFNCAIWRFELDGEGFPQGGLLSLQNDQLPAQGFRRD